MRRHSLAILAVLTCFSLLACYEGVMAPDGPAIFAREIPSTELPVDLNASRTYAYPGQGAPVEPERVLRWLWEQGSHPRRAWNPLPSDAVCPARALTSYFTVELDATDARLLDEGFIQGTDGLWCTTRYMSYQVLE